MLESPRKIKYDIHRLHPKLRSSWNGEILNHPLVQETVWDPEKANKIYGYKYAEIQNAISRRDWETYILLHESPYRPKTLFKLIKLNDLSPEEMWPLVGLVWCDTESVQRHLQNWHSIWLSSRPHRHLLMTEDERMHFDSLDSELIVWRGVNHQEAVRGYSWTLDRKTAVRFAHRFADDTLPSLLACARIRKDDVMAYFNDRGEGEVVAMPRSFYGIEVQQLPQTKPA